MATIDETRKDVAILGGGLAGLAAGRVLAGRGADVLVVERGSRVGGLARTIRHKGFSFDLGGHRFLTGDPGIEQFVREALDGEILEVERSSKILMNGRSFDYPWQPLDMLAGLGMASVLRILRDWVALRSHRRSGNREALSLEDWVVGRFGRTMFDIFVKEYSEKVWGLPCGRVSKDWVEQRIEGLSLGDAVKNMLLRRGGRRARTLARKFLYPPLGIGQIAEGLRRKIETAGGRVLTETRAVSVTHSDGRIDGVVARNGTRTSVLRAAEFASSVPVTLLVDLLHPRPPEEILEAAAGLRYRDLVIVAVMVDRARVTDQTWIYVPERAIPFGRIHEPTNWSARMAPPGKSLLVTEHFCTIGDAVWRAGDPALVDATVTNLERLGLLGRHEVFDGVVVRIPNAYPVFEIGYRDRQQQVCAYLDGFRNLRLIGRGGTFQYFNMDHAIESGVAAAKGILADNPEFLNEGAPGSVPDGVLSARGRPS